MTINTKYTIVVLMLGMFIPKLGISCEKTLPVEGAISIPTCEPGEKGCTYAESFVYDYIEKIKDEDDELVLAVQTSPWRIYDQDQRILTTDELANKIRPILKGEIIKIRLISSWSGVNPGKNEKSLAEKLSVALNGFPVEGTDGFLWLKNNGEYYTTRQAFSVMKGNKYMVTPDMDVMQPLTTVWLANLSEYLIDNKDSNGLLASAVGWDTFMLCPDKALELFKKSGELGNAIAAYNAAIMLLDSGDTESAVHYLTKASNMGDNQAKQLLSRLK